MRISVRSDIRDVERSLQGLERGMPTVISRALNRTIQMVRTRARRAVAEDLRLPQKHVTMTLERSTRTHLYAAVEVSGRRIPLIAFHARGPEPSRGKGRGVSYTLPGGRGRIAEAFIATMRSGHRGVFKRVGTRRLPIRELFGPSLPHVFVKEKILTALKTLAGAEFRKNLAHEAKFLLSRGARAA